MKTQIKSIGSDKVKYKSLYLYYNVLMLDTIANILVGRSYGERNIQEGQGNSRKV